MFSCEFCQISHDTFFKESKKYFRKKTAIVDVRPGSKYASVSSH